MCLQPPTSIDFIDLLLQFVSCQNSCGDAVPSLFLDLSTLGDYALGILCLPVQLQPSSHMLHATAKECAVAHGATDFFIHANYSPSIIAASSIVSSLARTLGELTRRPTAMYPAGAV